MGGRSAAPRASPRRSGSLGPVHRDGGAVKQDTTVDRGDQNRGRCGDAYQSGQWGGGGSVMCHMGSSYRCVVQGAKQGVRRGPTHGCVSSTSASTIGMRALWARQAPTGRAQWQPDKKRWSGAKACPHAVVQVGVVGCNTLCYRNPNQSH
jgi:hypothetical protein